MRKRFEQATPLLPMVARAALWLEASTNTVQKRKREFRHFVNWCHIHHRDCLPASPETVAMFLGDVADRCRPTTVACLLSSVAWAHRLAGEPFDTRLFTPILRGIRRTHGMLRRQAAPITVGELRAIVDSLPDTVRGARDRALLTVGFAGALRCSDLVGLDIRRTRTSVGSVEIDSEGAHLRLHRSKHDVTGQGLTRWLPRGCNPCPVDALERWFARARITSGPVFRTVHMRDKATERRLRAKYITAAIRNGVYRGALVSGASEPQARARAQQVSGHSLRVGFVTSALSVGVSSEDITEYVGWRSARLVFYYTRRSDPLGNNPAQLVLAQ
jgi:integrase